VGTSIALGQAHLGLHVVDANGLKVGYLWDPTDVIIFINGTAYEISATAAGFVQAGFTLYYETGDCSGSAWVNAPVNSVAFLGWATHTSDGVFHYAPAVDQNVIVANSNRDEAGDGSLSACNSAFETPSVVPVTSAPAPAFTPPFRLVDALQVSPAPAHATFNDVPTTDPAFKFIEALAKSGITSGCQVSPPLYCPDNQITRREMAVFLAVALGL
jgi:hypothetical protein